MQTRSIKETIQARYSCRSYMKGNIEKAAVDKLTVFIKNNNQCPFNSNPRFILESAREGDDLALKDLGTYGFVKNPSAFIIGAVNGSEKSLEDFGYVMEKIILYATELGLDSCWLGGSFNKSAFSDRIKTRRHEFVPAVASLGIKAEKIRVFDSLSRAIFRSSSRKQWSELFFHNDPGSVLKEEHAGKYHDALEMLRLGPSAENKQPWRIIKDKNRNVFHLYLYRSNRFRKQLKMIKRADLQKIDMGIAMCHFELTASELKLAGSWQTVDTRPKTDDRLLEYTVTWIGNNDGQ